MSDIRFFYNGNNLDYGKRFLKPSSEYINNNLQDLMNQYKLMLQHDLKVGMHPAKCPAMNSIKIAGWTTFNHYELTEADAIEPIANIFPNYPNSDDYVLLKYNSKWNVNIPIGYYLTLVPTLYHTGNWFALPGIIDPAFKTILGTVQLNSFIFMKKGEVIPIGSPIAQWIVSKKETLNVIVELTNKEDLSLIKQKEYLRKLKETDHEKYNLVRNSQFFKE